MSRSTAALFLLLGSGLLACDKEPTKLENLAKSATAPAASSAPAEAKPAVARPPLVTVEDAAAMIDGDRIDFATPDVKGQLALALSGKKVEGETIAVIASRDVKMPKVANVVAALVAAKAKGVVIKTAKRDKSTAEIPLAMGAKREGCAAVGFIAKDGVINAWPASGASAARFSRGMAGPDITRGSEGVRKQMASCDAPQWFVSADDGVTWGLVVDLVVAVQEPEDGGTPAKAKQVALLTKTAVPGRKIEDE
jgi:hypothetical protein